MDGEGSERFDTVIVGAGQAGLSAGYYLKQAGRSFVIVDANDRIGGSWRTRYDSLRLFTPSWAVKLPGWRFPRKGIPYPTRDQMADYLEAYAGRFDLPVRTGVHVERDLPGRGPVRPVPGRREDRGRPRDRCLGRRPEPAGPGVLPRARSRHRPDALERLPQPFTAPRRRRPRGGCRKLGRRHLARRRRHAPDVALRPRSRARPGEHRQLGLPAGGVPDHPVRRAPRADDSGRRSAGRRGRSRRPRATC